MKFDVVVGNPPYGRNSNLAIQFLNKATELSDLVCMVVPSTFNKQSVLNKINKSFHLKFTKDNPIDSFSIRVTTSSQIWKRLDYERNNSDSPVTHNDFQFVKKEDANLFIGRVGCGPAGKVKTDNFDHYSSEVHYFLKCKTQEVIDRLVSLENKFVAASSNTVCVRSLSKTELVRIYTESF